MAGLTIDDPVTLAQALSSGKIIPGDVIKLRAGTYPANWIANIGGSADAPVKIMPYNNEVVKIDGTFSFGKPYLEIYDLEFLNSDEDRYDSSGPIAMHFPGCWLIGCDIHDMHASGVYWMGSGAGGIVECLFRNNGYLLDDESGHGHAIYTHNGGGARLIARNIFFSGFSDYNIHIFSGGDNYLKDYTVEDNSIFGDQVHTGGGLGLVDFIYRNNIQYLHACDQGRYSTQPNVRGSITNNILIGLSRYTVQDGWVDLTESGNIVYGGEPADRTGYTQMEAPATLVKIVPFTKSNRWLGSVSIYNRDSAATVAVDFVGALADGNYLLRNGQNPAETWAFTYAGSAINVPMDTETWSAAAQIGGTTPDTTFPVFGAFVIEAA